MNKRILTHGQIALKKCRHGLFAYYVNDAFIGRSLDLYGEWTEPEFTALDSLIFPGSVVVDVGAFIGTHTVFFAQKAGPRGFVYAFEPQKNIYYLLCANVALNNLLNVKCLNQAVSDEKGVTVLPTLNPAVKQNFGAVRIDQFTKGEVVNLTTIDSLNLKHCHLIKIDVEGWQAKVLQGAKKTINKLRPILYVENNLEEKSAKTLAMLASLGYKSFWHIFSYFNPQNFFNNPENVFANIQPEANLLCFPKEVKTKLRGFIKVSGKNDTWLKAIKRFKIEKP